MHIVDVCAFYTPNGGGVRTYVEQKLAIAAKMDHSVTVLAPGEENAVEKRSENAQIVTIRAPRFLLDRKYRYFDDESQLFSALDKLEPDFVEVSSPWRSPLTVARWRPSVPKSLVMHADPLAAYAYRWLCPPLTREWVDNGFASFWAHLRKLGSMYQSVICSNSELRDRLSNGGIANTVTIPMGVEQGVFSPGHRDAVLRSNLLAQCNLPPDACLLISAGRLAPEKRVPMLVDAVTHVGRSRPIGLIILGEGRDCAAVQRAISGNPHIRLFKPVTNRAHFASIMASCDALLHGCEAETFGMVAAEANASGLPVIVPDAGGAADFARNGQGLTYRTANARDLQQALAHFCAHRWRARLSPLKRDMETHFASLFEHYSTIASANSKCAA